MNVTFELFSPRWGHGDTYTVELERDHIEISMQVRTARAEHRENRDPEWSGEAIEDILSNDSIAAPDDLQGLFEYVWTSWRNGELSDEQVVEEIRALATWINAITAAKPRTDFWRRYF
ncbi:hypothetical protein WJ61_22525 [Burkholderia ubonensis]|uniref:hypothetical protein n=1 Tax=Burkholderia ubonensis TaxID=101571 RepID=UPI0007553DB8|nr:hypothetical protein [Burkholderia ubonensis]KVM69863.1 hypothetical protein WJ61_22525 [Burkholderia ubonensis]